MTMTKKEQAAFAAIQTELAELRALTKPATEAPKRDLPVPQWNEPNTSGWDFNAYSRKVYQAWSGSTCHGDGPQRRNDFSASQRGIALYSTKALAVQALRAETVNRHAKELAEIDKMMEAVE